MSTDLNDGRHADIRDFHSFLTSQLNSGNCELTPEQSLAAFRQYQEERDRFRKDIQPALDQLDRGEGRTIDFDRLTNEVAQRLTNKGVAP